jgi:hypothetical protein
MIILLFYTAYWHIMWYCGFVAGYPATFTHFQTTLACLLRRTSSTITRNFTQFRTIPHTAYLLLASSYIFSRPSTTPPRGTNTAWSVLYGSRIRCSGIRPSSLPFPFDACVCVRVCMCVCACVCACVYVCMYVCHVRVKMQTSGFTAGFIGYVTQTA